MKRKKPHMSTDFEFFSRLESRDILEGWLLFENRA